jgi:hypothetical protein
MVGGFVEDVGNCGHEVLIIGRVEVAEAVVEGEFEAEVVPIGAVTVDQSEPTAAGRALGSRLSAGEAVIGTGRAREVRGCGSGGEVAIGTDIAEHILSGIECAGTGGAVGIAVEALG